MKVFKVLLLLLAASASQVTHAQYPNKVVRLIVPFAAGDSPDVSARVLAAQMSTALGQQVIVENRPGASGAIAAEAVARSPADGYTLLYSPTAVIAITPQLRKTPYDPNADFEPVARVAAASLVLTVNKSFPASTWPEFVAEVKANPGKYTYASSGDGTILHLSAEHLQSLAGLKLTHVPYKGLAPAMTDLLSGQVNATLELSSVLPHIRAGNAKPILVLDDRTVVEVPDVPTIKKYNVAFDLKPWFGVFAPRGTPKDVMAKLTSTIAQIVATPAYKEKLPAGLFPSYLDAAAFGQSIKADQTAYGAVIKRLNLKLE
jgi:tripartite-type tricarboxylate transporter receptor subunit TctC